MRLTKEQAKGNRRRIIAEAGKLFRERGFDGISVAELMQAAGFTHGGFYNHFASKSELMAEVTNDVLAMAQTNLLRRTDPQKGPPEETFAGYIDHYLSLATRDDPGRSCPIATLGHEVNRQDEMVKAAFAKGLRTYLDTFAEALPAPQQDRHQQAIAIFAALIGGLAMARAVAGVDEAFSREILSSVGAIVKQASPSADRALNDAESIAGTAAASSREA